MFAYFLSGAAALAFGAPPAQPPKITSIVLLAPGEAPPRPMMSPPEMISPMPGGSLVAAFRPGDYPKDALAKKVGGVVRVRAHIAVSGRIDTCTVTASSGLPSLDEATCRIIRDRAVFKPAHDDAGKPIDTNLDQGIYWQPSKPVPDDAPRLLTVITPGGEAPKDGPVPIPLGPDGKPSTYGLVSLLSADDYPAEALRNNETGTVVADIAVDASGAVTGCEVVDTSKSPSLDAVTCEIFKAKAKFRPAHDPKGRAVAGHYVQRVRWVLPESAPMPFASAKTRIALSFDNQGALAGCKADDHLPVGLSDQRCAMLERSIPSWISKGQRIGQTIVFEMGFVAGAPEALATIGHGPGQRLIEMHQIGVTIDPDGKVVDCALLGDDAKEDAANAAQACEGAKQVPYAPLDLSSKDRSNRRGTNFFASYFDKPKA